MTEEQMFILTWLLVALAGFCFWLAADYGEKMMRQVRHIVSMPARIRERHQRRGLAIRRR